MDKIKKIVSLVLLTAVLAGVGWGGWLWYDSVTFYTTQDAQVTADTLAVIPELTARLKSWDVQEGDTVEAGQVLGRQELEMLVGSSAVNGESLENSAGILVSKAAIRSPINGRVVQTAVTAGQVVSPAVEAAIIADTDHLFIRANVEETNIFKIRPGQAVEIRIDAYPGVRFHGQVERIGQATHQAFNTFPSLNTSGEFSKVTQLVPVRISLLDIGDRPLLMGMNTTVKIHLK